VCVLGENEVWPTFSFVLCPLTVWKLEWEEFCSLVGVRYATVCVAAPGKKKKHKVDSAWLVADAVRYLTEKRKQNDEGDGAVNLSVALVGVGEEYVLKHNVRLWKYLFSADAFASISLTTSCPDDQRIAILLLRTERDVTHSVTPFVFPLSSTVLQVLEAVNLRLHFGYELKYYGLYHHKGGKRGEWLRKKHALSSYSLEDMSVVEMRHLPLVEVSDPHSSPPKSYLFTEAHTLRDLIAETCRGVSGVPTMDQVGVMYLPHGENSVAKAWLMLDNTLLSHELLVHSVLIVRHIDGQRGGRYKSQIYRVLHVRHSPYEDTHTWKSKPRHPYWRLGEAIVETVESVDCIVCGRRSRGELTLTNAHLVVTSPSAEHIVAIPIHTISRIEKVQSIYALDVYCKHFVTVRIVLERRTCSRSRFAKVIDLLAFPKKFVDCFAFQMKRLYTERDDGWEVFQGFDQEMIRQIIPDAQWRISWINVGYQYCDSYPNKLIVPQSVTDELLLEVFPYRSKGRIPVLTYYHTNGAALVRSSQPLSGLTVRTCESDEILLEAIRTAGGGRSSSVMYIFDARPRINAMGNQAAGAGYEATGSGWKAFEKLIFVFGLLVMFSFQFRHWVS
jgi:hypothetical protein